MLSLWKLPTCLSQGAHGILVHAFCQNAFFFYLFEGFQAGYGQISSNLPKKAFATWQHFVIYDFFARTCTEIKISRFLDENVTYVLKVFVFFFNFLAFSFFLLLSFCCSDWPSTGHVSRSNLPRKHHHDAQLLSWSSHVWWQEILLWVFHSSFWAFLCISQAPLSQSLWSRHHWKDLFLLQKLSIDDANFGQKWWHQKWKKGQGLSQTFTGGTGVNGLRVRP